MLNRLSRASSRSLGMFKKMDRRTMWSPSEAKAVVLGGVNTVFDPLSVLIPLQEVLIYEGITIRQYDLKKLVRIDKKYLDGLLRSPEIEVQFQAKHRRPFSYKDLERIHSRYLRAWKHMFTDSPDFSEGFVPFYSYLKKNQLPIALSFRGSPEEMDIMVQCLKGKEIILDHIEEMTVDMNFAELLRRVVEKFGVEHFAETIVFSNIGQEIVTARQYGHMAVGIGARRELVNSGASEIIGSLAEASTVIEEYNHSIAEHNRVTEESQPGRLMRY